jgi:transcriptional regulator with GAF, ATPase, and Fis domain
VATGVDRRIGKFESAQGGTLFLDELGDLSAGAQAMLLRVLQERVVERIGGRRAIPVDVRVLAATNKDLEEAMSRGTYRADLYYRLKVINIGMPPLRAMREDIAPLAVHFLGSSGSFVDTILEKWADSPRPLCEEGEPWNPGRASASRP